MSQFILQIQDEAKAKEVLDYLNKMDGIRVKDFVEKKMSSEAMKSLIDLKEADIKDMYGDFSSSQNPN
ncbi:MAG: hypothetical protein HC842_01500 [Cytophagales bacterium]|nr:hypothetical protein [Cytophagales bacterium]